MSSVTSTTSYWKTPTATSTDSSSTTGTDSLTDFDSFLSILATELQYQDPTDPVSSSEYVSQMAQISSLQQLNSLATTMDSYKAYSMIGQTVSYETTDSAGTTTTGSGTVDSVITKSGSTYLVIDGTQVDLSSVVQVSGTATATA